MIHGKQNSGAKMIKFNVSISFAKSTMLPVYETQVEAEDKVAAETLAKQAAKREGFVGAVKKVVTKPVK
jgi:uncharacterized Rmd1/YagE family protein